MIIEAFLNIANTAIRQCEVNPSNMESKWPTDIPSDGAALNVGAANHVDEVDVAVAAPRLNVAPGPLSPVVRILVIAANTIRTVKRRR
jgi:hypothetical protein